MSINYNKLSKLETLCETDVIAPCDLALPTVPEQIISGSHDELDEYLGEVERSQILQALEKHRWNKTKTAKSLGMTLRALRYRLQKLNLT